MSSNGEDREGVGAQSKDGGVLAFAIGLVAIPPAAIGIDVFVAVAAGALSRTLDLATGRKPDAPIDAEMIPSPAIVGQGIWILLMVLASIVVTVLVARRFGTVRFTKLFYVSYVPALILVLLIFRHATTYEAYLAALAVVALWLVSFTALLRRRA